MRRFFVHNLTAWPAERLSSRVLYVLVGITGVVFVLFWLVGFNLPFGIGMGVWSVLRTLKVRGKSESVDNNIPTRKISYAVVLTTLASLLLFFFAGSSRPMTVNGVSYTDGFWLKTADMFIYTSLLMIVAGVGVVVYGAMKYNRKNDI